MFDSFPTPRFANPWSTAVPIPIEDLFQALDTQFQPFVQGLRETNGFLDAYLLKIEGQPWISVGVRYGNEEPEYHSLMLDPAKAASLYDVYLGAASLLSSVTAALEAYEQLHEQHSDRLLSAFVELGCGKLYEYDGEKLRARPLGTKIKLEMPTPKMIPEFVFCVIPARKAFGPDHPKSIKSCVLLHSKKYWDEHKHLDDSHQSKHLSLTVKKLIGEVQESVFESKYEPDEIRKFLEKEGLVYSEAMQKAMEGVPFF